MKKRALFFSFLSLFVTQLAIANPVQEQRKAEAFHLGFHFAASVLLGGELQDSDRMASFLNRVGQENHRDFLAGVNAGGAASLVSLIRSFQRSVLQVLNGERDQDKVNALIEAFSERLPGFSQDLKSLLSAFGPYSKYSPGKRDFDHVARLWIMERNQLIKIGVIFGPEGIDFRKVDFPSLSKKDEELLNEIFDDPYDPYPFVQQFEHDLFIGVEKSGRAYQNGKHVYLPPYQGKRHRRMAVEEYTLEKQKEERRFSHALEAFKVSFLERQEGEKIKSFEAYRDRYLLDSPHNAIKKMEQALKGAIAAKKMLGEAYGVDVKGLADIVMAMERSFRDSVDLVVQDLKWDVWTTVGLAAIIPSRYVGGWLLTRAGVGMETQALAKAGSLALIRQGAMRQATWLSLFPLLVSGVQGLGEEAIETIATRKIRPKESLVTVLRSMRTGVAFSSTMPALVGLLVRGAGPALVAKEGTTRLQRFSKGGLKGLQGTLLFLMGAHGMREVEEAKKAYGEKEYAEMWKSIWRVGLDAGLVYYGGFKDFGLEFQTGAPKGKGGAAKQVVEKPSSAILTREPLAAGYHNFRVMIAKGGFDGENSEILVSHFKDPSIREANSLYWSLFHRLGETHNHRLLEAMIEITRHNPNGALRSMTEIEAMAHIDNQMAAWVRRLRQGDFAEVSPGSFQKAASTKIWVSLSESGFYPYTKNPWIQKRTVDRVLPHLILLVADSTLPVMDRKKALDVLIHLYEETADKRIPAVFRELLPPQKNETPDQAQQRRFLVLEMTNGLIGSKHSHTLLDILNFRKTDPYVGVRIRKKIATELHHRLSNGEFTFPELLNILYLEPKHPDLLLVVFKRFKALREKLGDADCDLLVPALGKILRTEHSGVLAERALELIFDFNMENEVATIGILSLIEDPQADASIKMLAVRTLGAIGQKDNPRLFEVLQNLQSQEKFRTAAQEALKELQERNRIAEKVKERKPGKQNCGLAILDRLLRQSGKKVTASAIFSVKGGNLEKGVSIRGMVQIGRKAGLRGVSYVARLSLEDLSNVLSLGASVVLHQNGHAMLAASVDGRDVFVWDPDMAWNIRQLRAETFKDEAIVISYGNAKIEEIVARSLPLREEAIPESLVKGWDDADSRLSHSLSLSSDRLNLSKDLQVRHKTPSEFREWAMLQLRGGREQLIMNELTLMERELFSGTMDVKGFFQNVLMLKEIGADASVRLVMRRLKDGIERGNYDSGRAWKMGDLILSFRKVGMRYEETDLILALCYRQMQRGPVPIFIMRGSVNESFDEKIDEQLLRISQGSEHGIGHDVMVQELTLWDARSRAWWEEVGVNLRTEKWNAENLSKEYLTRKRYLEANDQDIYVYPWIKQLTIDRNLQYLLEILQNHQVPFDLRRNALEILLEMWEQTGERRILRKLSFLFEERLMERQQVREEKHRLAQMHLRMLGEGAAQRHIDPSRGKQDAAILVDYASDARMPLKWKENIWQQLLKLEPGITFKEKEMIRALSIKDQPLQFVEQAVDYFFVKREPLTLAQKEELSKALQELLEKYGTNQPRLCEKIKLLEASLH